MNPVLARDGARFGWQTATVKTGAMGGVMLLQWMTRRRVSPKTWAAVNFAVAGTYCGAAIRNWRLPR